MFQSRRTDKRQDNCDHGQVETSSFNGITRYVCTECGHVSFESTGDTAHSGGVASPRHVVDAK